MIGEEMETNGEQTEMSEGALKDGEWKMTLRMEVEMIQFASAATAANSLGHPSNFQMDNCLKIPSTSGLVVYGVPYTHTVESTEVKEYLTSLVIQKASYL